MPRFYFHIHDDLDCQDHEGSELPSLSAARDKATSEARLLMCDLLKREGRIALNHCIDIENDEGGVLATVPFSEVVKIES